MQGISYADDKRGRKSSKGKMVVCETTQGLSKAESCSHPQGWRDSGRQSLHQRVHPPQQSPGAGLSEWGPQSTCPDCRLTLSSVPVTLGCHLHPVHLLLAAAVPTDNQWFVPSYMKPHPCTFCPWKLTQDVCSNLRATVTLIRWIYLLVGVSLHNALEAFIESTTKIPL